MMKKFEVVLIDKDTNKVSWIEEHENKSDALKAMKDLKKNHFNPDYFDYFIREK